MKPVKRHGGFTHLDPPKQNGGSGWYVSASSGDVWYLHSDLELYKTTGNVVTSVYPGYYKTEALANEMRDKYYAKYRTSTQHDIDAFDRAMKGI